MLVNSLRWLLAPSKIISCNRLLKTGCNNVVGATLFLAVGVIYV